MSEFSPARARGYEIRTSTIPIVPSLSLFLLLLAAYISRSSPTTEITLWIVFVSALVSSIAGFAFSPIAGAVLFYANPDSISVVQVLLVASLSQQLYCVWRLRDQIKSFEFIPYSLGGLAALPIGILLLLNWRASAFLPMLGLFLCAYGSFIALKPTVPCGKSNPLAGRILAGALGGITGGLAAFPGAFVVIWSHVQGFEKLRQRSIEVDPGNRTKS